MKKVMLLIVLGFIMSVMLCGCSEEKVVDNVSNVTQKLDENVLAVKNGSPEAYPDITYGEAFDNYFGSPKWKYFKGTVDGPDEDEDGKPDYTKKDVDIVEFKGKCTYADVEVEALIQFTLEDDTFEATYLSFNKVPQGELILAALLESVFEDEDVQKKNTSNKKDKNKDNDKEENTEKAKKCTDERFSIEDGYYINDEGDNIRVKLYDSPKGKYIGEIKSDTIEDLNNLKIYWDDASMYGTDDKKITISYCEGEIEYIRGENAEDIFVLIEEYTCNLTPGMYKTDKGEDLSISIYTSEEEQYIGNMESKKIDDLNGELEIIGIDTYGNRAMNEILVHDPYEGTIKYMQGDKVLKVFKLKEEYIS